MCGTGEGYITAYLFVCWNFQAMRASDSFLAIASSSSSVAVLLALYWTTHTPTEAHSRVLYVLSLEQHAWFYALVRFCDFKEGLWSSENYFEEAGSVQCATSF